MNVSELEKENVELTVENESLSNQNNALRYVLSVFQNSMTDSQRAELQVIYQHTRDQHLNNFDLDEDEAESLEALFDLLEDILG